MIKAFLTCMGMFTKLPVPMVEWEDKKGPLALCFLPIAGFFCGLFVFGVYFLCYWLNLATDISAFLILIAMFAVSGFVHLDGFMDISDAFLSSKDREGKIAVLKDSRVGAFSVISVVFLILLGFISMKMILYDCFFPVLFILIPMISRSLAALIIFLMKPLQNKGLMFYFKDGQKKVHLIGMLISTFVLLLATAFIGMSYLIAIVISIATITIIDMLIQHDIGGINGDVAGATIVLSEFLSYLLIAVISNIISVS